MERTEEYQNTANHQRREIGETNISPTRNPSSLITKGFYQLQDDTLQLHSTFRISLILLYNSTLVNFE